MNDVHVELFHRRCGGSFRTDWLGFRLEFTCMEMSPTSSSTSRSGRIIFPWYWQELPSITRFDSSAISYSTLYLWSCKWTCCNKEQNNTWTCIETGANTMLHPLYAYKRSITCTFFITSTCTFAKCLWNLFINI